MNTVLQKAKSNPVFRRKLIAKLQKTSLQKTSSRKSAKLPYTVVITRYEEDVFSSSGVEVEVQGKLVFPEMEWMAEFEMRYSPRNSSWPIESITLSPRGERFITVKEGSFWWKFFVTLHEQRMLIK